MTLATTTRLVSYNGAGTTGPFPYSFMIFNASDLLITKISVTGVETELILGADYTVTGVKNRTGGNVTLTVALAIGETLVIERLVEVTQTKSFRTEGKFSASSHEDAYDKLTMIAQQHADEIDRSVKLALLSTADPTLPAPIASKVLGWNASGTRIVNTDPLPGPIGPAGPAGSGGPIPLFANPAARDAFYPAPAVNNLSITQSIGYYQRFGAPSTGANKWLNEIPTRAGGPIVSTQARGLVADGATDDSAFLTEADGIAAASGGVHEMDALAPTQTKVSVNNNVTLGAHFRIRGKTKINVAAGKLLILPAQFEAGPHQVFDPTMLGNLSFTRTRTFDARWFGIVGDGVTDDTAAWKFMIKQIPDYSRVLIPDGLRMIISDVLWIIGRRGIQFISTVPAFPDGQGASFIWDGPSYMVSGSDMSTTDGSPIVTTTTGRFTAAMVGQMLIIKFTADNNGFTAKILSYQSATQVTLDRNVSGTRVNRQYYVGNPIMYLESCDHISVWGFDWQPATGACMRGEGGYISAGTNVLHEAGTGRFTNNHINRQIWVIGAGPGGTDLFTTITGFTDANTVTLAANATVGIASNVLTPYIIGNSNRSLPAAYSLMLDRSGNGATGTAEEIAYNHFWTPINYGCQHLPISVTSGNNQEYHRVFFNAFFGGSNRQQWNNGAGQPQTFSVTAGSNIVTAASGVFNPSHVGNRFRMPDAGVATLTNIRINNGNNQVFSDDNIFRAWMLGKTITIPGAGAAGGTYTGTVTAVVNNNQMSLSASAGTTVAGLNNVTITGYYLDAKIIGYTDATHVTLNINATTTAGPLRGYISQGLDYGVHIGPSSNAKRITMYDNHFIALKVGLWHEGGSFMSGYNNFSANEVDKLVTGNSEPCLQFMDNSEQAFQHIDVEGGSYPWVLAQCRWGNLEQQMNGGYINLGTGANIVIIDGCGFDNRPTEYTTTSHEYQMGGSGNYLVLRGNRYGNSPALPTFASSGLSDVVVMGGTLDANDERTITDLPVKYLFSGGTLSLSIRKSLLSGAGQAKPHLQRQELVITGGYNDGGFGAPSCLVSRLEVQTGQGPNYATLIPITEAGFGQSDTPSTEQGNFNSLTGGIACHVARLPTRNINVNGPVYGYYVKAPAMSGGGIPDAYGLFIEDILTGGGGSVTRGHGLQQLGLSDTNQLNGITSFGSGMVEKATVYIDIGAGGNATPNSAGAMVYRYRLAGAATINKPINLSKGSRLKLVIFNNTGGAVTPTLNAAFLGTGFGAIAAGKSRSREYIYDDVLDKLEPMSAVSEDF